MAQVIIYTNSNGNTSVCVPTGELPIEDVLHKDCPEGAIIVDDSTLPQGDDSAFFDAWELNGSAVLVNMTKAQTIAINKLNAIAKGESKNRITNSSVGLINALDDADWLDLLTTARENIAKAKSTTDFLAALIPIQQAIDKNS